MIIQNATILDFRSRSLESGMDVHIQDGRVTAAGKELAREGTAGREDIIHADGLYLIPGLVNTHAHTAMTLLRGAAEDCNVSDWFNKHVWLYEQNLRPEDVYWGTLLGAAEMLLAGVTCVADHYFHMDHAWRAFQESGIRADLAWAVFGAGDGWQKELDQAMEFTSAYRAREPRLTVSLGPHSPYICPEPFLRTVADKAGALGARMHIHVSEEKGQVERSLREKGKTPVEVLDTNGVLRAGTILAHCYHATDSDLALVRERGAGIAHCAKTYLKFGDVHDFLPRALAAGVTVGLGSDGPASNNTMSILETARFAALLAKASRRDPLAARVEEVLPLCHAGGQVLGLPHYGRVEPGCLADLVLVDPGTPSLVPALDPFANLLYSFSERSVHTVIVDGRVLVRQGKPVHLDLEQLSRKASEIAERLKVRSAAKPMQTY
ncbi:MAG TPA: amidohydrolase [Spirochaetia bacterium]|nr:amidohydrolase [Spirochaetia bacterium]